MDIICGKCGKHFSSIENAREHRGRCKVTPSSAPIQFIPDPTTKISAEDWEALMKALNASTPFITPKCESGAIPTSESIAPPVPNPGSIDSSEISLSAILNGDPGIECPTCKQMTLRLSTQDDKYECSNRRCEDSFFRITIDKIKKQNEQVQKSLSGVSENGSVAWVGNEYYDPKKKKWRNGAYYRKGNSGLGLGSVVLLLLVITFLVMLFLHYFGNNPSSSITTFFGW